MDSKDITEPLLLTSLLLIPVSFIYFHKKYHLVATSLFLNGIASYIYHYKHIGYFSNNKADDDKADDDKADDDKADDDGKFYEISDRRSYILDVVATTITFILSLYLAKDLSNKKKYNLSIIVSIAFFFYLLNLYHKNYNYHLAWHVFVVLGQLFLGLNLKSNTKK